MWQELDNLQKKLLLYSKFFFIKRNFEIDQGRYVIMIQFEHLEKKIENINGINFHLFLSGHSKNYNLGRCSSINKFFQNVYLDGTIRLGTK